ncbi:MAG TPA: hypothetical protein VFX43_21965 [Chitinophagaceae bacterium]|nr:hypothetical protein [Chitinophagaceae bacterium]
MFTTNYYLRVKDTIADLHRRGFISDFVLLDNSLFCAQTRHFFNTDEFNILEVHSFGDDYSDKMPTVVYAIECRSNTIKGILFQNPDYSYKQAIFSKKLRQFWK